MEEIMRRLCTCFNEVKGIPTLLCMLAIMLTGVYGTLQNGSLYPEIAQNFGIAREINTFITAAFYLLLAFIAIRKPSWLENKQMLLLSLGCTFTSVLVLVLVSPSEDPYLTVLGLALLSLAYVCIQVYIVLALYSLKSLRAVTIAVVGGFALSEISASLIPNPQYMWGVMLSGLLVVVILLCLLRINSNLLKKINKSDTAYDLELLNPNSFLTPTHSLFLCILLFSFASGYGLTLNEVAHTPIQSPVVDIVIVCAFVWLFFTQDKEMEDKLFTFAALMVIAGFLIAPFTFGNESASANVLLRIGNLSFSILQWLVIVAIGRRNIFALLPTFGIASCMRAIGVNVGAIAGHISNDLVGPNWQLAALISDAALFIFIAILWVAFRKFSFSETIRGISNAIPVATIKAGDWIDESCAVIGAKHKLTERETEICAMLARGRNGQYVQDYFVVSRNTVKSHIKHIYRKLDVHSQQELIDLVEAEHN